MARTQRSFLLSPLILGVLSLSAHLPGQALHDFTAIGPVTTDWSHHHLIFSRPSAADQAKRVQKDVRYWQQLSRQLPLSLPSAGTTPDNKLSQGSNALLGKHKFRRDWAEDMGSGASVGAGNFPAKFSFATTQANCGNAAQPDFVVYSTGLAGSSGQASIVA